MPDADDTAAATETWEKMHQLYGNGMAFGLKTERGTYPMPEWVIDAILRLRDEAREAQQLRDSIEKAKATFRRNPATTESERAFNRGYITAITFIEARAALEASTTTQEGET